MTDDTRDDQPINPDPTWTLPRARHLADLTAFYDKAIFNKDGSITLSFKLPAEERANVVALADNDGMALNVRVWETALPEGMQALARAVGLSDG